MTRERAKSCGQNRARCGELVASGGVLRFVAFRLARKPVSMEALEKHARATAPASVEIRTPAQPLVARSRRRAEPAAPRSTSNPAPRKALNLDPRFAHGSNINCMCKSCGK